MSIFAPANVGIIGLDPVAAEGIDCESYGASPSNSSAGNYQAIQAALTAAANSSGSTVTLSVPGTYLLNNTLVISSNTRFVIGGGVTLKQAPGTNKNVLVNACYRRTDINISTLTSSGLTATATTSTAHGLVVGDYVLVNWATPEYYTGVFRVLTVPSTTQFTYSMISTPTNATASAGQGGQIKCRKADANIIIENYGTIDYDSANNAAAASGMLQMAVIMMGVSQFYVRGTFINAVKYNLFVAGCADMHAYDLFFVGTSDGIHLLGPCVNVSIESVSGRNDDNLVAIGTGDYAEYTITEGGCTGITVNAISAKGQVASLVRLFGQSAFGIDAVINGISGAINGGRLVEIIVDAVVVPNGNTYARNVVINNVVGDPAAANMINIQPKTADYIEVSNVYHTGTNLANYVVNVGGATGTIRKLKVRNLNRKSGAITGGLLNTVAGDTITYLEVDGFVWDTSSTGEGFQIRHDGQYAIIGGGDANLTGNVGAVAFYSGTLEYLVLDRIRGTTNTTAKLINIESGTLTNLKLQNCYSDTMHWVVNKNAAGNLNVEAVNCVLKAASGNVFRNAATGILRVRSAGCDYPSVTQALVNAAGGTVEAYGWDIPGDPLASGMGTTNGQFMNSTNATAAKQGPSVRAFSINAWYALATGAAGVNTAI